MPSAARVSDMHLCPLMSGITPHTGGPILPPGCATVFIAGLPAACIGDLCSCSGPTDSIAIGSASVNIGGIPAARAGDATAHGGIIISGCATVNIG